MTKLRFAPLIRVSTEKQGEKADSYRLQKKQILTAVEVLKGIVPENCWEYVGQESATEKDERKIFDKLLSDCSKNQFDAIQVQDVSRWSRNNLKHELGLEILKQNGIRFFTQLQEFNLYDSKDILFLSMQVSMNACTALENAQKSLMSRIEKAKLGYPSGGPPPYGRIWNPVKGKGNPKAGWSLDKSKRFKIEAACKAYLEGDLFSNIAKRVGISENWLYDVFKKFLGDKLQVNFKAKKFPVEHTETIWMPRLVSPETEAEVKARLKMNCFVQHKEYKNKYLLKSLLICGECGGVAIGANLQGTYRYYRHSHKIKNCTGFKYIREDLLNDAVLKSLFEIFGDKVELQKAVQDAQAKAEDVAKIKKQKSSNIKELKKIDKGKDRIIDLVADGLMTNEEVEPKLNSLRERQQLLYEENAELEEKIKNVSTEKEIVNWADGLRKRIKQSYLMSEGRLEKMTFDEKRKLLESIFILGHHKPGKTGIFLKKQSDGRFRYDIKASLDTTLGGFIGNKNFNSDKLSKGSIGVL